MNKDDIRYLERLHACLHVPLWKTTQTAPIGQLVYAEDCRDILSLVRDAIRFIALGKDYSGEIEVAVKSVEEIYAEKRKHWLL